MNKSISLGMALSLAVILAALCGFFCYEAVDSKYDSLLEGMPDKMQRYEILDEVDGIIKNNYIGEIDKVSLSDSLVKGYISSLGDSNSRYMTAEEYLEYKSEIKGDMQGIGIEYEKTSDNKLKIARVYDGSPAKNQGLKKGDTIVAFDGIKLTSKNFREMAAKLEDSSDSVNLIYKRNGKEKAVTIQKGYEAESVSTGVYQGKLGYISISDFYSGTSDRISSAIETFIASGISGIVLDLRENKSVNYDEAMECLDLFLPMTTEDKPAATVTDNNGNAVKTFNMTSGEINLPVSIMVSSSTASAAEIFVCDMKNINNCSVYGDESTKGDCLVQEIFELTNGGAVLLSVGKITPYSGDGYEKSGISPDYIYEYKEINDDFTKDKLFLYVSSSMLG